MWTKICGIRDVETALGVAKLRPDAIGLNFYAGSRRHITSEQAAEIVRALPSDVEPMGLFVNHTVAEVVATVSQCGLRTVQIHGDEPVEFLQELSSRQPTLRIVRALRVGERGIAPLAEYLTQCDQLEVKLWACLVDADVAGQYGGTGQIVPWDLLQKEYDRDHWPRLILAGGLTPENVAEAIRTVRPWGVDTAGGVESSPGVKDLARVESFITGAKLVG